MAVRQTPKAPTRKIAATSGWVMLGLFCRAGLSACGDRPGPETLMPQAVVQPANAQAQRAYLATTRGRCAADRNTFSNDRVRQVNYGSFDISIPPSHQHANVE